MSCRSEQWLLLSGAALARRKAGSAFYPELKSLAAAEVDASLVEQVDKDLPRCFLEAHLAEHNDARRSSLRSVFRLSPRSTACSVMYAVS